MSDPRYITFIAEDPRLEVRALFDEDPATPDSGYGGWEEIERARRTPLTDFTGSPLYRVPVPIVLDGFQEGLSVDNDVRSLVKMARPVRGGPPPIITVDGEIPHNQVEWVIEDLEWGEVIRRSRDAKLLRVHLVVKLLQYVDPDQVDIIKPGSRKKCRKRAKHQRYTVKKSDKSLKTIAARELGASKCWRAIANKQKPKIRDPKKIKVGQVLKMPWESK